ncbi:MAG: hypothetical protein EBZ77_07570 [Chitinophagia bacterium]|nr:hypothetical protein [Chitinophagia bacterium]
MNRIACLFFLFLVAKGAIARQLPEQGATVHYRLIGFSWLPVPGAREYMLEIAEGNMISEGEFAQHIVVSMPSIRPRIAAEVPAFGKEYTWRITEAASGFQSPLYHFNCAVPEGYGGTLPRMRILKDNPRYKRGYVFADGVKAIFNMKGEMVWAIPQHLEPFRDAGMISDLKPNKSGTITFFLNDSKPYDISYSGQIIWKAPPQPKEDELGYHHELLKTSKGNYLMLGNQRIWVRRKEPTAKDTAIFEFRLYRSAGDTSANEWKEGMVSTLVEFDKNGLIIWNWSFLDYFKKSDLANVLLPSAEYTWDLHPNALYYDERNNYVYASLRNVNRIIKINKSTGAVEQTYGRIFGKGAKDLQSVFSGQHAVSLATNGDVLLYDNESADLTTQPRALRMQQKPGQQGKVQVLWEYPCSFDGLVGTKQKTPGYSRGGNVVELADKNLFISMNTPFSKVIIVDPAKKELWSAAIEIFNEKLLNWECVPQYRANILLNPAEVENMLFYGEPNIR